MNTYTIYYHTFPNGKMYFGQTCQKPEDRWGKYGSGYKGQKLIWRAIQKYGWDNIEHRVISIGLDKDEADFQEMFYISAYRTNEIEFGYNQTIGGEGTQGFEPWNKGKSNVYSDETKEKMSLAKLGKHYSPSTEFKKGETPWNKSIKYSQERIQQMSEYSKNHPNSGNFQKGHIVDEITKQKIAIKKQYITENGEIIWMRPSNVKRWHPDWKEVIK